MASKARDSFFGIGVFALVSYANYLVFLVVPNEQIMGAVQRIFYFHVGSAVACYLSLAVVLVGSLTYLAMRSNRADVASQAGAEVGFVFATIVLVTGMIWGQAAWNTPFRWEPRLVSFLVLWMILLSMLLLRSFATPSRVRSHASVLGIIGALSVPIVIYSIKLLPQTQQLHPVIVEKQGLAPIFRSTLFWAMGAVVSLQALLVWIRFRIGVTELSIDKGDK